MDRKNKKIRIRDAVQYTLKSKILLNFNHNMRFEHRVEIENFSFRDSKLSKNSHSTYCDCKKHAEIDRRTKSATS